MSCAHVMAVLRLPKLTWQQRCIYLAMVDMAVGDLCRASARAVAEHMQIGDRSIAIRAIRELRDAGLVAPDGASGYRLLGPKVEAKPHQGVRAKRPQGDDNLPSGVEAKCPQGGGGKLPSPNGGNPPIPEPSPRARVDSESSIKKERESDSLFPSQNILPQMALSNRKRPAQIPSDWKPNEAERKRAIELGVDPDKATEEFVAYWQGVGKPRADWQATFRNRVLVLAENGRCKLATMPRPAERRPMYASGCL